MRRTRSPALVAAALAAIGATGCTAGNVIQTSDASADARDFDAVAMRDARASDSVLEARTDAPPIADSAVDALPSDSGIGPDVAIDTGPPLPVSCDRTGVQDCSPSSGMGRCPDGPSVFSREVNAAIDAVIAENPGWFVTAGYPSCCPLIQPANVSAYMQAVTDHLTAVGLCASGPGEELGVKYNNDCSESWDLVANPDAATNLVRRHYVGDCFPAFF